MCKVERFHQTLVRRLDKQPLADILEQLRSDAEWVGLFTSSS